jgi:hypothetical protein
MRERRGTMPGLNLIPEDDLYLAFVSTTDVDPWLHDLVDGNRKLAANRRMMFQSGNEIKRRQSPEGTDIIDWYHNASMNKN